MKYLISAFIAVLIVTMMACMKIASIESRREEEDASMGMRGEHPDGRAGTREG